MYVLQLLNGNHTDPDTKVVDVRSAHQTKESPRSFFRRRHI